MSLDYSIESLQISDLQTEPIYPLDLEQHRQYYNILREISAQIFFANKTKAEFSSLIEGIDNQHHINHTNINVLSLANNAIRRSEEKIIKYSHMRKIIRRILNKNKVVNKNLELSNTSRTD